MRTTWKVPLCLFLQLDDQGTLKVRAADGLPPEKWSGLTLKPTEGLAAQCFGKNVIMESGRLGPEDSLAPLLNPTLSASAVKYAVVPVAGQARVLGLLILGPFPKDQEIRLREAELRSAGALCAVISAHWRLYEWMSNFLPQVNHELRTPLTAVQGSIDMVLGGMFGQVGSEVKEMLEMAHKGCERTVRAIEDYLSNKDLPKK
jgi:signal transduction histidine kinase